MKRLLLKLLYWMTGTLDVDQLQKDIRNADRQLKARERSLQQLLAKVQTEAEVLAEDLEKEKKIRARLTDRLNQAREENKILSQVTVPGLTAANALLIERVQADTAVQVHRRVGHDIGAGQSSV